MKRYIKYIISIFSLSCIASCSINDEIANPNDGGHMSLRLVSSTMTRAEGDNDNSRNEDKLVSADLYFYASDGQDSTKNAKWHTKINIEGEVNEKHEITNLILPSNIMQSVFGNGDSGYLYVIANYPSTATALPTYTSGSTEIANSSIKELAMYEATAQWGPSNASDKTDDCVQDSFLMAGASAITKSASNVEGTIYLTRAAAKIELTITGFNGLPEGGVEDGEGNHWLPDFITHNTNGQEVISIGAFVKLQNAVANSYVGAPMAAGSYEYDETTAAEGFYGYSTRADDGSYSQLIPFYSYSSDWSATGGANRASLLLVVPWKKVGTNEGQNCYYEIPIGARDNNLIERNKHYKIGVNVGTLGSFAPSTNVKITPAYITVVDWSTGQIDVNIAEAKYLVVDQTEIEIFNQTDCAISYASSHPVTATIDSIVFNSYKLANTRKIKITSSAKTITPTASNLSIADVYTDYDLSYGTVNGAQSITTLPKGNATFGFTHAIPTYYTPRTIYVTVQHTGDESFSEQVKIVQYPPIYFIGEKATGRVYVNAQANPTSGSYSGVNDDDGNGIGSIQNPSTVTGKDNDKNNNVNNYDIYVTVLPSNSTYQIGDPRETSGSTLSGIDELKNYRKTRTDAVNVIAPAFKIASSRGKTTPVTSANATKRCASYQENGFPAGRWRVPTPAEIEFIVSRSAGGDIPSLFDGEYWAANGQYFDSDDTKLHNSTSTHYVRCVYDVWYWGSDKIQGALNKAVWGDAKDNATLNVENPVN